VRLLTRLFLAILAIAVAQMVSGCAKKPQVATYITPELTTVRLAKRCKFDPVTNKVLEKCDFRLTVNGVEVVKP
jgi:type IV pilus biogenesis protein CpaD/CtpE